MMTIRRETFLFIGAILLIIGGGFAWCGFGFHLPKWIVNLFDNLETWWKNHTNAQQVELEAFAFCLALGVIFLWIGMHK